MNKNVSDQLRGTLYIVGGIILLLHTLGWIEKGLDYILIAAAIYMIVYGFFKGHYATKIAELRKNQPTPVDTQDSEQLEDNED